jgi:hypothetical protein|nr:MAG TPA: hypothetical protein [Caudoviricetes sp.]
MNADVIAFVLLVLDALLFVAGIIILTAARIHDEEVRLALLASLPIVGRLLAAAYRRFDR